MTTNHRVLFILIPVMCLLVYDFFIGHRAVQVILLSLKYNIFELANIFLCISCLILLHYKKKKIIIIIII